MSEIEIKEGEPKMTRAAFEEKMRNRFGDAASTPEVLATIEPCDCGHSDCFGWSFDSRVLIRQVVGKP